MSKIGSITIKEAYDYHRPRSSETSDFKDLWTVKIPPRHACIAWKLFHNRIATDYNVKVQGTDAANCCNLCPTPNCNETQNQLFFSCMFAKYIWSWIMQVFNHRLNCDSINSLFASVRTFRGCSQTKNLLWIVVINCIWLIWLCRNKLPFENCIIPHNLAVIRLECLIVESGKYNGGFSFNTHADKHILDFLSIRRLAPKFPKAISVKWLPPSGWIKLIWMAVLLVIRVLLAMAWCFATSVVWPEVSSSAVGYH